MEEAMTILHMTLLSLHKLLGQFINLAESITSEISQINDFLRFNRHDLQRNNTIKELKTTDH